MKMRIATSMATLFCLMGTGSAMFIQPQPIPLERIAKNTKAYLESHPDDPDGYYTLGRIYYLGFVNKASFVPGFNDGAKGQRAQVAPDWLMGSYAYQQVQSEAEKRARHELGIGKPPKYSSENWDRYQKLVQEHVEKLREEGWKPATIPNETALTYAVESKNYFQRAIEKNENNALYLLGLASLYEQVSDFLTTNKIESSEFADIDKSLLLDTYWKAFDLSRKEDAQLEHRPVSGLDSLVSFEAGKAWIRLGGSDDRKSQIIQKQLDKLGKLEFGAITPLVITADTVSHPSGFVLADTRVNFDLDGEGHAEAWEWITPDAGLLVWDPTDRRTITSGVQLFGNYTFEIIWRDGFHALAVLDDNGDRVLDRTELEGLSVWYDRNSNGFSEANEVTPVQQLGIASLSYDDVVFCDGIKVSKHGVTYQDGSRDHLWDWISYTGNE